MLSGTIGNLAIKVSLASSQLASGLAAARGLLTGFGNSISGTFLGAAAAVATLGTMFAVKFASDMERSLITFETLLGSVSRGRQMFEDLQRFAVITPFESFEINKAAKQLLAVGIEADKIVPTLTALGDASSAGGRSLEDLATIFGRVKTAGRITNRELRQLVYANIPIIQELAKVMEVPADKIRKMAEEGKIGFNEVAQAFENLSNEGGRFHKLNEKISQTWSGLWSTFTDSFKISLGRIGQAMIEGLGLKDWLRGWIEFADALADTVEMWKPAFREIGEAATAVWDVISEGWAAVWPVFAELGSIILEILPKFGSTREAVLKTMRTLAIAGAYIWDTLRGAVAAWSKYILAPTVSIVTILMKLLEKLTGALAELPGAVGKFFKRTNELLKDVVAWGETAPGTITRFADTIGKKAWGQTADEVEQFFNRIEAGAGKSKRAVRSMGNEVLNLRDGTVQLQNVVKALREISDEGNETAKELEKVVSALGRFTGKVTSIAELSQKVVQPAAKMLHGNIRTNLDDPRMKKAVMEFEDFKKKMEGFAAVIVGDPFAPAAVDAGKFAEAVKKAAEEIAGLLPPLLRGGPREVVQLRDALKEMVDLAVKGDVKQVTASIEKVREMTEAMFKVPGGANAARDLEEVRKELEALGKAGPSKENAERIKQLNRQLSVLQEGAWKNANLVAIENSLKLIEKLVDTTKAIDFGATLREQIETMEQFLDEATAAFEAVIDQEKKFTEKTLELQQLRDEAKKKGNRALEQGLTEQLNIRPIEGEKLKNLAEEAKIRLEIARATRQQIDALRKEAVAGAAGTRAQVQSPLEKFHVRMENLRNEIELGGLSWDDYALAVSAAFSELEKASKVDFKLPEAMVAGSKEAVSLLNRALVEPRSEKDVPGILQKSHDLQQEHLEQSRKIAGLLQQMNDKNLVVVPLKR